MLPCSFCYQFSKILIYLKLQFKIRERPCNVIWRVNEIIISPLVFCHSLVNIENDVSIKNSISWRKWLYMFAFLSSIYFSTCLRKIYLFDKTIIQFFKRKKEEKYLQTTRLKYILKCIEWKDKSVFASFMNLLVED